MNWIVSVRDNLPSSRMYRVAYASPSCSAPASWRVQYFRHHLRSPPQPEGLEDIRHRGWTRPCRDWRLLAVRA